MKRYVQTLSQLLNETGEWNPNDSDEEKSYLYVLDELSASLSDALFNLTELENYKHRPGVEAVLDHLQNIESMLDDVDRLLVRDQKRRYPGDEAANRLKLPNEE